MEWIESKGIEKEIILVLGKKKMFISEVANKINKPIQTVSPRINQMESQNLINKEKEYSINKDARKSLIYINKGMIKIKRMDKFYNYFFILALLTVFFNFFLFIKTSYLYYLYGSLISIIPIVLYMAYFCFFEGDKITVYKKTKD